MERLRAAFDEAVEIVKAAWNGEPQSPVEVLLDQHLPLEEEGDLVPFPSKHRQAVAIPTFVMNDFASRTSNVVDYPYIQGRIWEILIDYQHNPSMMKKVIDGVVVQALNLLQYLLINGSTQVLKDCQEPSRSSFLRELAEEYNRYEYEQYQFSQHLDIGAGVRKTAAEINTLLEDESALLQARRQAEKLHQSLSSRGLRSSYPAGRSESPARTSIGFHDEARPPVYTDSCSSSGRDNDIGSKIVTHPPSALENSEAQW
ncbi:hypothetical protein BBJ28_00003947 [Nothophytophthora sp. Chile5]|nr:hypothetical protein BBJ28_00003947 [Nothophytophthora sp. Chile5]